MKKKETLWQFLTRPTGFGKTSWTEFVAILTAVVLMYTYALAGPEGEGLARWCLGIMATLITAIMARGTWRNFKGKQG